MDQNNEINLDSEFKRFLKILRPYLCQLCDLDIIEICNAWIQKLSNCGKREKALRNKYVFALCYQLANGVLNEPFLRLPAPYDELSPLPEDTISDGSFTEGDSLVINSDSANANILFHKEMLSETFSDSSEINVKKNKDTSCVNSEIDVKMTANENQPKYELNECYKNPMVNNMEYDEHYHFRASNLIMKLREIRNQNIFLRNELKFLKEECKRKSENNDSLDNSILKIDTATITYNTQGSNTTLTSLKCRLQEVQCSRNSLIQTVDSLQDKLENLEALKNHEIEEIQAKHKLEMIKLRRDIREELKVTYEMRLEGLRKEHESNILELQRKTKEEIDSLNKYKEQITMENTKLLQNKQDEIHQLKHQLEELKGNQVSISNKLIDTSNENSNESVKLKSLELEKQLNKIERAKNKTIRTLEAKILSLQREKQLTECSLQLQLTKQRAQVVNEMTNENQAELVAATDHLENKYKEIVANMQATALQRRIQDQLALESLIQAICGVENEKPHTNPTNAKISQFPGKTIRNHSKERNQNRDKDIETLCNSNRADNGLVGKSFGENSIVTSYCLDTEKLQELFERVQIPQRDVNNLPN